MIQKLCVFVLCTLGFVSWGMSQRTLEFNQVKLVTTQETVPAGKVWKVESVLGRTSMSISTGTTSEQSQTLAINVNGTLIYLATSFGSSYSTGSVQITRLPLWLPAGATLQTSTNAASISVIEFNVIP